MAADAVAALSHRPRLLDLFCGAGVGAEGYVRAGWHVVGVDKVAQPHYRGHEFIQADALTFLGDWNDHTPDSWFAACGAGFSGIHASPPCQFATDYRRRPNHVGEQHENLIPPTRELLEATGLPYVIENVEKARPWLHDPTLLCGSMFDLDVQRHRLFEESWVVDPPTWPCRHEIWTPRFPAATNRAENSRRTVEVGVWRIPLDVQKAAMGVDWEITRAELSQGIPPAYCPGPVYCIDPWNDDADASYPSFLSSCGHFENLVAVRDFSPAAAARVPDVDMTFIDGAHSFAAVVADVAAWLPKTGHLLCGHDYQNADAGYPGVGDAVRAIFGEDRVVVPAETSIWTIDVAADRSVLASAPRGELAYEDEYGRSGTISVSWEQA